MIYDPITGIIMGVLYGVPSYLGACFVRFLAIKFYGLYIKGGMWKSVFSMQLRRLK